jgi:RNA-directed DNA polymerase
MGEASKIPIYRNNPAEITFAKSPTAHVMASLTRFIEEGLKLQINAEKSAAARPWQRSFLDFTVKDDHPLFRRCIAGQGRGPVQMPGPRVTGRYRRVSLERMIGAGPVRGGWAGYFNFIRKPDPTTPAMRRLGPVEDAPTMLREVPSSQRPELSASEVIFSLKEPWRLSFSKALHRGFTNARFRCLGLPPMRNWRVLNQPNRCGTDPYARWCGRGGILRCPPIPIDAGAALDQ